MDKHTVDLTLAASIIKTLQQHGVDPILYGSLGASLYLGNFKTFGDVDLLVPSKWLHDGWEGLQQIVAGLGFKLVDAREHEFQDDAGISVAFAEETVLTRDNILSSVDETITAALPGDCTVRTLSAQQFKQAYQFSEKDGYRKDSRGKKDAEVIALLEDYLAAHPA